MKIDYDIKMKQHFIDRSRERIDPDLTMTEIKDYAIDALKYGLKIKEVKTGKLRRKLMDCQKNYGYTSDARIIDGLIFIFDIYTSTALTVYRVPWYATYEQNYEG